ncbi:MAG: gentisate 1,2-dioxygenase [Pacificimonas sp.]|jgi:gentisate 1,2-dioxygenase|nr:gentisate 1,2-dioxygenase [Pacificimonas sp.]
MNIHSARSEPDVRRQYYEKIGRHSLSPLWESLHSLVPKTPTTLAVPVLFNYREVMRPYLLEAGELISAEEAERRVLILENPGLVGQASITNTLYAGLQMVLPGEVAPTHRHSQTAIRFVLEGGGAYTAVDGEKTFMTPGDLVTTPGGTWHDHGNDSDEPIIWLDGLDIPLVRALDAGFAEAGEEQTQSESRPAGDSEARFASNMAPVDWQPDRPSSPIFNYTYEKSRDALMTVAANSQIDACHGHKMRYINPATGGAITPTIGAFLQQLPAGFETRSYRSTDATVFSVVEGTGESRVGDTTLRWQEKDVFVVPSWKNVEHRADRDAVLFSFSDRPVHEVLGLWLEERGEK